MLISIRKLTALFALVALCLFSFTTNANAAPTIYTTTEGAVPPVFPFYVLEQDGEFLICSASDEQEDINPDTLFTCDSNFYPDADGTLIGPDSRGKFGFPDA